MEGGRDLEKKIVRTPSKDVDGRHKQKRCVVCQESEVKSVDETSRKRRLSNCGMKTMWRCIACNQPICDESATRRDCLKKHLNGGVSGRPKSACKGTGDSSDS